MENNTYVFSGINRTEYISNAKLLNQLLAEYHFINHKLNSKQFSTISFPDKPFRPIEFQFDFTTTHQKYNQVFIIEGKQFNLICHFTLMENTDLNLLNYKYFYDSVSHNSPNTQLNNNFPFKIEWEIDFQEKKIASQELDFTLFQYGPKLFFEATSWGDKPKYKFWNILLKPLNPISLLTDLLLNIKPTINIKENHLFLKLTLSSYQNPSAEGKNNKPVSLKINYKNQELNLADTYVEMVYNLKIGNANLILKVLKVAITLYQYDKELWHQRLNRNIFGGGNQIFMLSDENGKVEFFITKADVKNSIPHIIKNITAN